MLAATAIVAVVGYARKKWAEAVAEKTDGIHTRPVVELLAEVIGHLGKIESFAEQIMKGIDRRERYEERMERIEEHREEALRALATAVLMLAKRGGDR